MSEKARKRLKRKFPFLSVVIGVVTSLITGLIENTPLVGGVDTAYYGYPIVWRIVKTLSVMEIRYIYLFIDAIFWVAVSFLIFSLINEFYFRETAYE